jgi:hypothetical protein
MTIRVTVKNEEAEGAAVRLAVTVVTVGGNSDVSEAKHRLAAQESVTVHVHTGQFITVEETQKELS